MEPGRVLSTGEVLGCQLRKTNAVFLGIGQLLIKQHLEWAENSTMIEKVGLSVFEDNHRAIHLYKKFDFVEERRRKNEIKKADGQYLDDILMYKLV